MKRREALDQMEKIDGDGKRATFSSGFFTAHREDYRRKIRIAGKIAELQNISLAKNSHPAVNSRQDGLAPNTDHSPEQIKSEILRLQTEHDAIDAGGRFIYLAEAAVSRARGMHSAKNNSKERVAPGIVEKTSKKAANHFQNRTLNLSVIANNTMKKLHKGLIMCYNGEKLLY